MRPAPKPLATALSIVCCLLLALLVTSAGAAPIVRAKASASAHKRVRSRHHRHRRHMHVHAHRIRQAALLRREQRAARERAAQVKARERSAARSRRKSELAAEDNSAQIATALATTCQNTELTPQPGNLELVTASVLCLINRERAEHGELPLTLNGDLEQAAEGHDQEMIQVDYFAHVSPSGITPVDRIREKGYLPNSSDGYVLGENLAWGTYEFSTPASIVKAWIASPGHLANILESQYTETGISIVPAVPESLGQGSPGATYAQEFGVIIH